jgi:hypothetical protein
MGSVACQKEKGRDAHAHTATFFTNKFSIMAWEISISPEGWQEIQEACHTKSKTWLFKACNEARRQYNTIRLPQKLLKHLRQEALADEAYQWIETTNTCKVGGYSFYIDPKGYYLIDFPR